MLINQILLGLFCLAALIQVYFLLNYFRLTAWFKPATVPSAQVIPVSVIISARNEEQNLQRYLDSVLQQDYPDYEVVVVNDCSYDLSSDILKGFKARYDHLKVVELEEDDRYKHGKKFALTLGIKAAKNEHLLFTDADCEPVSRNWIRTMQSHFLPGKAIVLGYSPYVRSAGVLNAFSRFETFYTAIQYFSFALANKAYMGVGRNLAYTKTLFFGNKGFASHMHLLSGDDDLFINEVATASNTEVCLNPESFVYSDSKNTWKSYFIQKMRHFSAGKVYKKTDKRSLSLIAGSGLLFYTLFITLLVLQESWQWVTGIFALRLVLTAIVFYPAMKRLHTKDLWWYHPVLDVMYYIMIPFLSLISLFRKQRKWK